jgi:hypothetical protein
MSSPRTFRNSVICLKNSFTSHLEILIRFKNEKSENNFGNPSCKNIPTNLNLLIHDGPYLVLISEPWSTGNRDRVREGARISGNHRSYSIVATTDHLGGNDGGI